MTTTPQIQFNCSTCNSLLRVPDSAAGQRVRCPKCNTVIQLPSSASGGEPAQSFASGFGSDVDTTPTPQIARQAVEIPVATSRSGRGLVSAESPPRSLNANPLDPVGDETEARRLYRRITAELAKVFVGQQELVMGALVALFSGGHVLIEGVPGLGKTLFIRTLGQIMGCRFGRIQFTADLMPSDVTGAPIFNMKTQEFQFRPGPVFTQLLLADEINRAPAKTHAALLEIMQEKNVTIDGTTHELEPPFIVLATQNPIESEGTYNLPEAQLDRFMFKLITNYPSEEQENEILMLHSTQKDLDQRLVDELETVCNPRLINEVAKTFDDIRVDPKVFHYVNRLVRATRKWPQFHLGASPRAGISLIQGSRTLAAFCGRSYVVPDDVVQIALPALRHRVSLTAEAEVEGQSVDNLLTDLIRTVDVPRMD